MMYVRCCKWAGVHYLQIQWQAEACWAKGWRVKNKSPLYFSTGHLQRRKERAKAKTCFVREQCPKQVSEYPHVKNERNPIRLCDSLLQKERQQWPEKYTLRKSWRLRVWEACSSRVYLGCVFEWLFRSGHCSGHCDASGCSCSSRRRDCSWIFNLGDRCSLQIRSQMITQ